MDKKNKFFIILFLSMFLVGTFLIFTTPSSIKVRYGLTTLTKDGETISFNVFEPDNDNKNKKAIIIGHGIMANKEFMKGYAIELAAAGFVAVPFDFRGHGQSSGELNRNLLINDVKAIKAYLASRGDIDM
ncbi:MAG: alpha/beta hydrolase, partial [Promethearchaeota archaeon]